SGRGVVDPVERVVDVQAERPPRVDLVAREGVPDSVAGLLAPDVAAVVAGLALPGAAGPDGELAGVARQAVPRARLLPMARRDRAERLGFVARRLPRTVAVFQIHLVVVGVAQPRLQARHDLAIDLGLDPFALDLAAIDVARAARRRTGAAGGVVGIDHGAIV